MFTRSFPLFRLFGFQVKADLTWSILAVLITWTFATQVFPQQMPDLPTYTYWALGLEGAAGLFLSIILHETGHALVARRYGIKIKEITLFIFGGVANMESEPEKPRHEFFMAIAGPLVSGALAVIFVLLDSLIRRFLPEAPVLAVVSYLAWLNGMLGVFNMIPAFPLDGGRVLRALLWEWKKDIRFATRIAAGLGSAFGFFLILLGVFMFINGATIQGVWFFMIGMFVRSASAMSYRQLLLRRGLEGERVSRFMKTDVISVQPNVTLRDFVENYVYTHHHKMYPVMVSGHLTGCVTTREVKAVPPAQWDETSVGEVAEECSAENSVPPNTDAMEALSLMNRTGRARLLVVEGGELLGIVSLKDLMDFLNLKLDLEAKSV